MDKIDHLVENARFIHITRDGLDVVASLYRATNEHPTEWAKLAKTNRFTGYTVEECVARWNNDRRISLAKSDDSNHHIVRYQDLVETPARTLSELCAFLHIDYEETMQNGGREAESLVREGEVWKALNRKPPQMRVNTAGEVFTEEQQSHIRSELLDGGAAWVTRR